MKTTNALLAGIFLALIFIGLRNPPPVVIPPLPTPAQTKWEYKVVACDDDSVPMAAYNKEHPGTEYLNFDNEFSLIKVEPEPNALHGTGWELCAWFLEPKERHPKLILIFKRSVK